MLFRSGTVVGDSAYKGQLDDDLVDFARAVGLDKPGIHRTLIGFSSGGGFVLRTAGGPNAALFDAYLPISPYVAYDSPTSRPAAGGWASVALPRFVALSVLDGLGLPWFQNLAVVRFATDAKPSVSRTPAYSWRLQTGMHPPRTWRQEIAGISRPIIVAVGSNDELFRGDQFAVGNSSSPTDGVTQTTGHLRCAAERIGVLYSAVALAMRGHHG